MRQPQFAIRCLLMRRAAPAVLLALALMLGALRATALGTSKPLKQYGRQTWQSDSGLPQNTVHALVQGRDGFLWMATESGLVRFDGQEFRTFDSGNTRGLASDSINDLAVDEGGAVWIATSGGLVLLDGTRFTPVTTANGLPSNGVRFVRPLRGGGVLVGTAKGVAVGDRKGFRGLTAIGGDGGAEVRAERVAEDAVGTVWVASGQQVFAVRAGSREVTAENATGVGEIQAIAAGAGGEIWIGGRGGLAVLRNGQVTRVDIGGATLGVTALLAMSHGEVWIGTDAGLLEFTHGAVQHVGDRVGIASGRVLRLFRDREGAAWVAFDRGVSRIVGGQMQELVDIAGVLSIFEDRDGDMWFGTEVGGATVLRDQAFSTLTTQDGLSDDFVRAIFEDHSGAIWVGTNRGGLNKLVGGRVSALGATGDKAGGGLSSDVVLALAEARGDLWIGTPDGLSRLRDGKLKLFTTADGLPDDFVRSLYADRDGSLWVGTRNGLAHFAGGTFTSYSRLDGLGSDLIGSILRGRDGTLWVGTLNGLSMFDGTGFRNFTTKDGLGADAVTTITEDHEGTLWIASHEFGLTRLRGGVFTAIAAATTGLPREIYSILEAKAGQPQTKTDLWLGSAKGVWRVSLDGLNGFADKRSAAPAVAVFGSADGMRISECSSGGHPAAWRMSDGTLWFATLKGAAAIDPAASYENHVAPLTAVEDVQIDDQAAEIGGAMGDGIDVPPGRERITIRYAGLSYRAPQKVRFRYMLEGFDHDWVEAGARRTAFYTYVPAGKYRFIVYASNGDGVWSEMPGAVRFLVRPHFYQTAWFYCLALLLAGLLVWLVYRSRVRTVEAQYQAVLAERNRIAREIHDTLAQGYVGISVQLEVASRLLQSSKDGQSSREAAGDQLERTKEYVRESLAEARSSIWNLRASEPGAASETLPARLAAAVESHRQPDGGAPVIRFDVHGGFRPIDRRVEEEFVKIGQEALNNALRHAAADTITVTLSYDTEWLKLTVADDGKGFAPAAIGAGHYGLQGMRERAAAIASLLDVSSTQERGTRVELTYGLGGRKARQ